MGEYRNGWTIALIVVFLFVLAVPGAAEPGIRSFLLPDRGRDGNRLIAGTLPLDDLHYDQVSIPGHARWVFAVPADNSAPALDTQSGPRWWIVTSNRQLHEVAVPGTGPPVVRTLQRNVDIDGPPALFWGSDGWQIVSLPELVRALVGDDLADHIRPLPDAQPAVSQSGAVAVLGRPTTEYPHGILGDEWEASSIYVIRTAEGAVEEIDLLSQVAEERGVLWADFGKEGTEVLVTVASDARGGAQLVAFRADGSKLASGPAIGRGFRWRHLVGYGPVWPGGDFAVVSVRTPHIGGVLEFSSYLSTLEIVQERTGYSSHRIGDQNLGLAALVDVTGNGTVEVVVPTQSLESLVAVGADLSAQRRPVEVWRADLGARVSSNISVGGAPSQLAMLVGTEDGTLHVWW